MNDLLNKIKTESQSTLMNALGSSTWNALDRTIQTGVLTSEICLKTLEGISSNADYSASIMPLMKVLENELIKQFYTPYLTFIKRNYTPDQYISVNHLNQQGKNPNDLRRKILYYNKYRNEYRFCNSKSKDGMTEFTIGNYQFTVGAVNYAKKECDLTAIRFYKEQVFGPSADDSAIVNWIWSLTVALDSLVNLRNSSAHAGMIQSRSDANTAMDVLVKVDKLLLTIVFPQLP